MALGGWPGTLAIVAAAVAALYYVINKRYQEEANYEEPIGRRGRRRSSTRAFTSGWNGYDSNEEVGCTICQDNIEGNSRKLRCGHMFHRTCITEWLAIERKCPNCRVSVSS